VGACRRLGEQLVSLKSRIESEQQRAAAEARLKKFVLQHRHVLVANDGNLVQAYCVGVLVIAPDGSGRFDCTNTVDPQGRCDHVAFAPGTIKQVKFLQNGLLQVATHHEGNFDFYGTPAISRRPIKGSQPWLPGSFRTTSSGVRWQKSAWNFLCDPLWYKKTPSSSLRMAPNLRGFACPSFQS